LSRADPDVFIWAVRELGISLTELARHPGISVPWVGYAVERAEAIARDNSHHLIEQFFSYFFKGVPFHIKSTTDKQRRIKEIIDSKEISREIQLLTQINGVQRRKKELRRALQGLCGPEILIN